MVELMNLCEFPEDQQFQLLYRASESGFSSANFHEKCDGIGHTLTLIKSINGNVFGGYTGAAWSSSNIYINDSNSFIFSLINQSNDPFKANCTVNKHAICGHSAYGPTYGSGHDFCILSNSNTNQNSYSKFGRSYKCGTYDQSILAGSAYFQTLDIEVLQKLN